MSTVEGRKEGRKEGMGIKWKICGGMNKILCKAVVHNGTRPLLILDVKKSV